ncbi:hypothetical protein FAM09_22395 [Niastella caeni]|uniref:CBM1 domain-containing protein n=1 Tax=Niastella caeni TaxID=2569763 RepID=A0A4S8HHR6_9BACT|nr:hypothetical protein FAM09_22395 [Niastella caeni]
MKIVVIGLVVNFLSLFNSFGQEAPPYSQCGGIGWTGPKICTAGFACTGINEYFHMCLPGG